MILDVIISIVDFINNIVDITRLQNFINGASGAFNTILPYIRGVFYILPFSVTLGCLSVVLVVYAIRVVMAIINIVYP